MKSYNIKPSLMLAAVFIGLSLNAQNQAQSTYNLDEAAAVLKYQIEAGGKKPLPAEELKGKIRSFFSDRPGTQSLSLEDLSSLQSNIKRFEQPNDSIKAEKKNLLWYWDKLGLRVRQDYNDVVESEDASVINPKAKRNQLAGASFSFSHDFLSQANTWSARGAIIRPISVFERQTGVIENGPLYVQSVYLVPSVSLHKVDTQADPKKEVDNLIYRLGGITRLDWVTTPAVAELEFRPFATYATDTHHRSSIVAGEFDVEPRIGGQDETAKYAVGFQRSLMPHIPPAGHPEDTSDFLYQVRLFGHGEFGDVRHAGGKPNLIEGSFFRAGPVAKLEIQPAFIARSIGMDFDALTFHTSYSYLPRLSGPGHSSFYDVGLDVTIFKRAALSQKIGLKLLYERGGVEISKEKVDIFTAGLGITF